MATVKPSHFKRIVRRSGETVALRLFVVLAVEHFFAVSGLSINHLQRSIWYMSWNSFDFTTEDTEGGKVKWQMANPVLEL